MISPHVLEWISFGLALVGGALAYLEWRRSRIVQVIPSARIAPADPEDLGEAPSIAKGWRRLLAPMAAHLRPTNQVDLERILTRLLHAGRRARHDVDRFTEEKTVGILLGAVMGITMSFVMEGGTGLFFMAVFFLAGKMVPDALLDAKGKERREAVSRSLPGAVDLLVTCLDAGLSLEQSVARVAKELGHSSPTLAEEFTITASEFEAGISLPDALRRLARRVGLDDLSAMCGVIAQAHALGAPVGQTLRDYALASRQHRIALLEERAGKLTTLLSLPLILCLLPAAMTIIIGPSAVHLVRALFK